MADRGTVFGLHLDLLNMEQTVARCRHLIEAGVPAQQSSLNAGKVVLASDSEEVRDALNKSDVLTADGQSVVWAGRLLGLQVPERVAGIDLMARLLALAEAEGFPVYFLGAREPVLTQFLEVVLAKHPQLRVAGSHHGYFEDEAIMAGMIRESGARLLLIAMPSPTKEFFVDRNRGLLGPLLAVGVGGSFDVWAGLTSRAPLWMQKAGLEWFYRLIQEPRKMWRRYLFGNTRFAWLTLREALERRS